MFNSSSSSKIAKTSEREFIAKSVWERARKRSKRERERKKIAKNAFDSSKDASANCIARALALQPTLSASSSSSTFERCQPPSQFFSQLQFFANIRLEADHKKKSTPELLFSLYSCFFLSIYSICLSITSLFMFLSLKGLCLSLPLLVYFCVSICQVCLSSYLFVCQVSRSINYLCQSYICFYLLSISVYTLPNCLSLYVSISQVSQSILNVCL